jgi:predicted nucleotidyltransferase
MRKSDLRKIAKKYDLKLFILFGSRARKENKKGSDWDLAFYPPKNFTIDDEMNLFNDLITLFNDEKVDLLNIKKSKKLHVINNVFQTGILIHEKEEGFFVTKKWDAWIDFQDFKRYYDMQAHLTKEKLKEML